MSSDKLMSSKALCSVYGSTISSHETLQYENAFANPEVLFKPTLDSVSCGSLDLYLK